MTENKLKSSLLEKYSSTSLRSSILTSSKSSLESSSLLKSNFSTFALKNHENQHQQTKTPFSETTPAFGTDRKKKLTESSGSDLAKKSKLLSSENSLVNHGLICKPATLSSNSSLFLATNSNSSFLKPSSLLSHASTNVTLKSSLLSSKLLNVQCALSSLSNKIEQFQIESEIVPSKRPYFHLESTEDGSMLLQAEYLKTDALIDAINLEQKKYDETLKASKKLKKSALTFMDNALVLKNELTVLQRQKNLLINTVSGSLLRQPNFKSANDPTRLTLLKCAESILKADPEFILKLALYTRQELNIRVTANFLICLAAHQETCRPFLHKYFKKSVQLPSDWIEVAEQYQMFADKKLNFGSLPSALRKVMVEKFVDFDQYQLAKYNKEKSRMAKNKSLINIKHVKSKLKDFDGNEVNDGTAIVEDKFIKTLAKGGLKINDRFYFEVVVPEKANYLKFDIVQRDEGNRYL